MDFTKTIIIPLAQMGSESIAHEAVLNLVYQG